MTIGAWLFTFVAIALDFLYGKQHRLEINAQRQLISMQSLLFAA
jgi:hypothetical protein